MRDGGVEDQGREHKRNRDGSLGTVSLESEPSDFKHEDMKALWEAEQTLNRLCAGLRFHIHIHEAVP